MITKDSVELRNTKDFKCYSKWRSRNHSHIAVCRVNNWTEDLARELEIEYNKFIDEMESKHVSNL